MQKLRNGLRTLKLRNTRFVFDTLQNKKHSNATVAVKRLKSITGPPVPFLGGGTG